MERGTSKDLSEVLDKAIAELGAGRSIEECLESYPQYASELGSLLPAAAELQAEAATPLPADLEAWLPAGARDFAAIADQMLSQQHAPRAAKAPRPARPTAQPAAAELSAILDEALDRIAAGETIEACLAAYPQQARALAPLLRTGVGLRAQAATQLPPDLEAWLPRGARDFAAIAERMAPRYAKRPAPLQRPSMQRAIGAVAVMVAMMVTVDQVSAASLPGGALYPWKRTKEDITLSLTSDPNALLNLHVFYANRRLDELRELNSLARSGDAVDSASIEDASRNLVEHVQAVVDQAKLNNREAVPIAHNLVDRSMVVLEEAATVVPQASQAVEQVQDEVAALEPQIPSSVVIGTPAETAAVATAVAADDTATVGPTASSQVIGEVPTDAPTDSPTSEPGASSPEPTPTHMSGGQPQAPSPTSIPAIIPTDTPTAEVPPSSTPLPGVPTSQPTDQPPPPAPTLTDTSLPVNTATPTAIPTPTEIPYPTATPPPTETQGPPPTLPTVPPTRTQRPTRTPPPTNTPTPTNAPTPTNTRPPTRTPTEAPTDTPTDTPPTDTPTDTPPTDTPTEIPPTVAQPVDTAQPAGTSSSLLPTQEAP